MTALSRRSFLAAAGAAAAAPLAHAAPASGSSDAAPKFKLGLVTYNVAAGWDLPTILQVCKKTGVAAVECRTTHKHKVEPNLSPDERRKVKRQFADSGVVFWGCGSTCEFHSPDPATVKKNIETCKRFVQLVADIGGKGVKVRPNGIPKGYTAEQACDQIGKALVECGKAAADSGVEIWVEVHGRETAIPKNMKRIMDACGHPAVGVTWNSNGTDLIDGSIGEAFDMLAKHIRSCHINDLPGKYPYRDLFRRLKGIGYDRYTLCEVGKSYDPKFGADFLTYYKALWTELTRG
jgi:sugar phosphate isomerase/epimerase